MAVTIRYKKTGKLEQVTRNVAFDLIERGEAERVYEKDAKNVKQEPTGYSQRELVANQKAEESEDSEDPQKPQRGYTHRQMRARTK